MMMRSLVSLRALRMALSLAVVAPFLLHAANALHSDTLQQLEHIAYDARVNLTLPATQDDRIVIVDIDEASLKQVGHWPWPRDTLARLVERLVDDYGARTVGFDVVFAERSQGDDVAALRRLIRGPLADDPQLRSSIERLIPQLDDDRAFARAIEGGNVVLGYFFRQDPGAAEQTSGQLPPGLRLPPDTGAGRFLPQPKGYGANLAVLQEAAAGGGFFDNPLVSSDGVFRRVPLLQYHDGKLYELLALATARAALDWPALSIDMARVAGRPRIDVELDRQGAIHVPYVGPQGSFPYVSAKDVLDGSAPAGKLEDRIVLVGTTAAGLFDLRTTPVQNVYPGVEIQANILSGILDQRTLHRPAYATDVTVVATALLGIAMTALLPFLPPLAVALATIAVAAGVVAVNLTAWSTADLVLPIATPLALIASLFVFHVAWGFFIETRRKRRLAKLFGQYVPPELVDEMDRAPETITLAGESREMTVLFTDVQGFTALSEQLAPQELTRLMNAFLTPMTRVIHQHRGTIDKYMGDAVMAFWGAPLSDPEHARHAVEAARELLTVAPELEAEFRRQDWPPLRIGIGLNTGVMNVGNMGSEFRMAYTVLGDAVNLGSRLEGLTRTYGVPLIVSETTRAAVPDHAFREIDIVRVKGKAQPIAIFEPLGPAHALPEAEQERLDRYHEALRHYRERRWDRAETLLHALQAEDPQQPLYALYLERIAVYRQHPPPDDWDGVFTHASK